MPAITADRVATAMAVSSSASTGAASVTAHAVGRTARQTGHAGLVGIVAHQRQIEKPNKARRDLAVAIIQKLV